MATIPLMQVPATVPTLTEFSMVLRECRERGMGFEAAWKQAMLVVRIERDNMPPELKQEMREWRRVLLWAKEHFEAAYERRSSESQRTIKPSLADALTRSQSAGNRSRVSV